MATAISNTVLTRTNSANPLANAPTNPTNPFASAPNTTPAQTVLSGAINGTTGYGTNGAPMSVVPSSLQSTPPPAAAKPATGTVAGTATSNAPAPVAPAAPTGIQPAAGYMKDPNNPNGVVKIGSINPNTGTAYGGAPTVSGVGLASTNPQTNQTAPYVPPSNAGVVNSGNGMAAQTGAATANTQQNIPGTPGYSPTGYNTTTNPVTYPGVVAGLANAAQPNSTQTGLVSNLTNVANSNPLQSGGAYDTYSKAVQNLNDLKQQIAQQNANIGSQAIPLGFQQGRKQVLAQQYASQLEAAQAAVNQAQAALGYGISEQQTQQSGLTSALGGANTQQGQTISGLNAAAGYAQPQLGSFGQGYYNPLTAGTSGTSPYGTGPAAAANVQSIQDHTKTVNDWSASRQSATNIGNQLTSFLQNNQVNPSDFNAANKFLQLIGANTSSPQYKQFYNLVTDLANTYAPVLGQGDASNYKVQLAQSLLDGTANGQSIPQILSGLDAQAQTKIAGEQEIIKKLESGQDVNPGSTAPNTTISSGGNTISTAYGNINPNL